MTRVTLHSSEEKRTLEALEYATPIEIIEWSLETFGPKLCVATSFFDTVLVHLATRVNPDVDVIFLDTGFHFPETLATMRTALVRYQLRLRVVRPEDYAPSGSVPELWSNGTVSCCEARKVTPLNDAMTEGGFQAWLSGLRRADGQTRAHSPVIDVDRHDRTKINPLANWDDADVARYIADHDLIVNPLLKRGYDSIGCWPCTHPGTGRDGRWSELDKTECGLHLPAPSAGSVR